jgi:2-oxoadipate dioxygenase/decarboxylase-like protein
MSPDATRLLDLLWERYAAEVPYARTFAELSGGRFRNDHIALRSLARPGGGIALFAHVFERFGWKPAGKYSFPETHLSAIHMSHPEGLPRVFISELHAEKLSTEAQRLLAALPVDPPAPTSIEALADWFSAPPPPEESALLTLERESQYGAWLLAFGRKVNHFTGTVDDVEAWQRRMLEAGVPMKRDIEGAPGGDLRQTATHAAPVSVTLRDGRTRSWPYAYFEIAQRAPGFDGFLDSQARALFDMTKR